MATPPKLSILTSLYRSEKYLNPFLEQLQAQSLFPDCEVVLVLNEASVAEREMVEAFAARNPERVQLHFVEEVETLGASWNRAWRAATASLLAIWNVDDRRTARSLEEQVQAMQANPDWALCYGDYVRVREYGSEDGERRHAPPFSRSHFQRAFPQGGAFWVLRRDASDRIGYFDEQFRVGPDMDLALRMAAGGLMMGRVEGLLGYFTDEQTGLSTRDGALASAVERTAIQMRYGVFDKVRGEFAEEAQRYRLGEVLSFGVWHAIEDYLPPRYLDMLKRRRPLWLLGWLRNALRRLLKVLGVLDWLYRLQKRFIRREL